MADSGTEKEGGGAAGWDRTGGGGGDVRAGCRPISFPDRSSPSRTCGPCCRSGSGRNTGDRCGRLWSAPGWASGGCQTCRRRIPCGGMGRESGGQLGRETAASGRPRLRRRRPPQVCATQRALQQYDRTDDRKYSFAVRVGNNGISYRVPESVRIAKGKEVIKRELLQTKK